jgi:hypothetical protein
MRAAIRSIVLGGPGPNLAGSGYTMSATVGTETATESPSGQLNLTGDGTNNANGRKAMSTVVGGRYRVRALVGGTTPSLAIGTSAGGSQILNASALAAGLHHWNFVATATTTHIMWSKTGAALATVGNISVRRG